MTYASHVVIVALYLSLIESSKTPCVCHHSNIDDVARVVFGEARGESQTGQLAVAYTIVNRVAHRGYPGTVASVLSATYNHGLDHQYNTLDNHQHDTDWANAKKGNNTEYIKAVKAAKDALCKCETDPTKCATDYCAFDPCHSTKNNTYYTATGKIQIDHHYFVCRIAVTPLG